MATLPSRRQVAEPVVRQPDDFQAVGIPDNALDVMAESALAHFRGVALRIHQHWGLPWLTRGPGGERFVSLSPPVPDASPPVDLSVGPLIYDQLVAEQAAAPSSTVPAEPRAGDVVVLAVHHRRRRRLAAVVVGAVAGAVLATLISRRRR